MTWNFRGAGFAALIGSVSLFTNNQAFAQTVPPPGGLSGSGALINPLSGQEAQHRAVALEQFYGGASALAGQSTFNRQFNVLETLFASDPLSGLDSRGRVAYLGAGGFFGFTPFSFARANQWLKFSAEFEAIKFDKNNTALGPTPNSTLGFNTDAHQVSNDWMMTASGVISTPLGNSAEGFVRGGYTWARTDYKHYCFSTCAAAGVPQQIRETSFNSSGFMWGVGIQSALNTVGGVRFRLRGEFNQHLLGNENIAIGDPANVYFNADVKQQINVVKGSIVVPFGGATAMSDIRLKRDIARVGQLDNGLPLYRYKYIWSDQVYVGVMAQEVAAVAPGAVIAGDDGYLRVNYAQLGTRLRTLEQWTADNTAR